MLVRAFSRHHVLTIGQVSVDVGSLGGQLCTPIAGLNVTLWSVARAFLRFVVAFGCMVWIYCEVVGVKTTGGMTNNGCFDYTNFDCLRH